MEQIETGLLADRIPFIRGGAGPRRAVVFFGGNALLKRLDRSSSPSRYARQVARLLPSGFSFWILGYEDCPQNSLTLDGIAEAMAGVMRAEIGKADVLIGISFGGFVALRLAASHPDLLDRLVLLVSAHRFSAEGRQAMERQFRSLERGDMYRFATENALLFRRPWYNWLVRLKLWKDKDTLSSAYRNPASVLSDYRSLFSDDLDRNAEYARRVEAETMVIGGSEDQYFDRAAFSETAHLIERSRLEMIAGETHMLPVEKSADVAARLAAFLGGSGQMSACDSSGGNGIAERVSSSG